MYRVQSSEYDRGKRYSTIQDARAACEELAEQIAREMDEAEEGFTDREPREIRSYDSDWRGGGACPGGCDGADWPTYHLECDECSVTPTSEDEQDVWMIGEEAAYCQWCAIENRQRARAHGRVHASEVASRANKENPILDPDPGSLRRSLHRKPLVGEIEAFEAAFRGVMEVILGEIWLEVVLQRFDGRWKLPGERANFCEGVTVESGIVAMAKLGAQRLSAEEVEALNIEGDHGRPIGRVYGVRTDDGRDWAQLHAVWIVHD